MLTRGTSAKTTDQIERPKMKRDQTEIFLIIALIVCTLAQASIMLWLTFNL